MPLTPCSHAPQFAMASPRRSIHHAAIIALTITESDPEEIDTPRLSPTSDEPSEPKGLGPSVGKDAQTQQRSSARCSARRVAEPDRFNPVQASIQQSSDKSATGSTGGHPVPWSAHEDAKLLKIVSRNGWNWSQVANAHGSRSASACRHRYVTTGGGGVKSTEPSSTQQVTPKLTARASSKPAIPKLTTLASSRPATPKLAALALRKAAASGTSGAVGLENNSHNNAVHVESNASPCKACRGEHRAHSCELPPAQSGHYHKRNMPPPSQGTPAGSPDTDSPNMFGPIGKSTSNPQHTCNISDGLLVFSTRKYS